MKYEFDSLTLRGRVAEEVFDYQTLLHSLEEYAAPRNRITRLLRGGDVVRVKKGLYVFGPRLRRGPVAREVLANLIYGPSYVSRESALRYWDMIPEEVATVTSMTTGRSRDFDTPLGHFDYASVTSDYYVTAVKLDDIDGRSFFIATPEKALADYTLLQRGLVLRSRPDCQRFLEEDVRIDIDVVRGFDPRRIASILQSDPPDRVATLLRFVSNHILGEHNA
jgi:hypothetical protein